MGSTPRFPAKLLTTADFEPFAGVYQPSAEPTVWFVCRDRELLIGQQPDERCPPCLRGPLHLPTGATAVHVIGSLAGKLCVAVGVEDDGIVIDGADFSPLRRLIGQWPAGWLKAAARAVQIIDWHQTHKYCGRCATPTNARQREHAKECPACGLLHFPRVAPAVIVRVTRGDRILLARSPHFPPGWFSVLAGFVEPGENLEEAVVREVREEVGIELRDIRYFGSQPWPFPHSLMVAFTARWASEELSLDPAEIEAADWFEPSDLPRIPPPGSISHELIRSFVERFDV